MADGEGTRFSRYPFNEEKDGLLDGYEPEWANRGSLTNMRCCKHGFLLQAAPKYALQAGDCLDVWVRVFTPHVLVVYEFL